MKEVLINQIYKSKKNNTLFKVYSTDKENVYFRSILNIWDDLKETKKNFINKYTLEK